MLSREDNDCLTQTGAGAAMGALYAVRPYTLVPEDGNEVDLEAHARLKETN